MAVDGNENFFESVEELRTYLETTGKNAKIYVYDTYEINDYEEYTAYLTGSGKILVGGEPIEEFAKMVGFKDLEDMISEEVVYPEGEIVGCINYDADEFEDEDEDEEDEDCDL